MTPQGLQATVQEAVQKALQNPTVGNVTLEFGKVRIHLRKVQVLPVEPLEDVGEYPDVPGPDHGWFD